MARCKCKTKLGTQCKNAAKPGSDRCGTHTKFMCTLFQQPSSSRAQQPSSSRAQQPSSSSRAQQPSRRVQQQLLKTYNVEFNGGTSYIVEDYGNKVKVYNVYNKMLMEIPYEKMFTIQDGDWASPFDYYGNAILLKIKSKTYILISSFEINEITTKDEIKNFYSPMGPSGILFPYATSDKYFYNFEESDSVYALGKLPKQVVQNKEHILRSDVPRDAFIEHLNRRILHSAASESA
jgi:hypothetical protein